MELTEAKVLITGASSGIGRATALELARRGARLALTGRDETALAEVAARTSGDFLAEDLAEGGGPEEVAEWAGAVDILVNNAAVGWAGAFEEMTSDRVALLIRTNLQSPIELTRAVLPAMVRAGRGRIVNVSSIAGHVGVPRESVYSATKWGLVGFSESLRQELAGSGVGVTVVSPGVVATPFFQRRGEPYTRRFPRPIPAKRVAVALAEAVERDRDDVFVPRWTAFPTRLRGSLPGLYRSLASRFGQV